MNIQSRIVPFFLWATVAYIALTIIGSRHISDDLWFSSKALTEDSYINFIIDRYYRWSSRAPIELVLLNTINKFETWKTLNSIMFGVLVSSFSASISRNANGSIISSAIFFITMMTIPTRSIEYGAIWMTGSINYLWPLSLSALGFSTLISLNSGSSNNRITDSTIMFFAILLSSFNEQIAAINTISIIILAIYNRKDRNSLNILLLAGIATATVLLFIITCPGNKIRFIQETNARFPGFDKTNIIEKIFLGVNLYFDQIISIGGILFSIMVVSISLISSRAEKYALLIIASLTLSAMNFGKSGIPTTILSSINYRIDNILSTESIIRFLTATSLCLIILYSLVKKIMSKEIHIYIPIIYLSSIASTVMMGLSPTVYASGPRALYISYVLMSIISAYMILKSLKPRT